MVAELIGVAVLALGLVVVGLLLARGTYTEAGRRMLPHNHRRKLQYVALGDGRLYGVGASDPRQHYAGRLYAHLRLIYPNAQMANLTASDVTALDVVARQLRHAVMLYPDLITLSVGTNDILQGRTVLDYEHDLQTIFRTLSDDTQAVLVAQLLTDQAGEQAAQFNAALRRVAEQYDVEVADCSASDRQAAFSEPHPPSVGWREPAEARLDEWANQLWQTVMARLPWPMMPSRAASKKRSTAF